MYFIRINSKKFTTSHNFKSTSNSSKRTQLCAKILDDELKVVYKNVKKLILFLLARKKQVQDSFEHRDVLTRNFSFVKTSPGFYLCPILSPIGNDTTVSLHVIFPQHKLCFSGKSSNEDESLFLKHQLDDKYKLINVMSSPLMSIVNTQYGGISYLGTKFKFVLIPREACLKYFSIISFINGLKGMQKKKSPLSSNRGMCHRVLFEKCSSNYVDLGIGVSRFMSGIYKKRIPGISEDHVNNVDCYFQFVQDVVKQHLPMCLLRKFNDALNMIGLEDLSRVKYYAEKKNSIGLTEHSSGTYSEHNFMPSASFGSNNLLPLHTDQDMFLSVVHVHCHSDVVVNDENSFYKKNCNISKYFNFDDGESVAMRSGDILIFNPTIPHCVSSTTESYTNEDVFCLSHYFKSLIAGRNNNKIEFSPCNKNLDQGS